MKIDVGHIAKLPVHFLLTSCNNCDNVNLLNRPVRSQDICRAFLLTKLNML